MANLAYVRNHLVRWHSEGLISGTTADCLIPATEPEVADLQTCLGLRMAASPADPSPQPAPATVPLSAPDLPWSLPLRPAFSWAQVGLYLLAERTLNTLLGLDALLIMASAFVISTLNPTHLGSLAHLGAMVVTMIAFYAAGVGVRRTLHLVRTGATLLVIGAGLIPLDIWTLGRDSALQWDQGVIWLVASTVCLPIYLSSHAALRDHSFALLTALAAGNELLAVTHHRLGIPVEWGLCALVGLAIAYLVAARRLPECWHSLAWALFWTAQAAMPLLMAVLLAARFAPVAWTAAIPATTRRRPCSRIGRRVALGAIFYTLCARGGDLRYRFLAAWTLPVAYLLTLTKAPWDASWYDLSLALLAAGYLAFGYWLQRAGAGTDPRRLLIHPTYGTAAALSLVALLWPLTTQQSGLATVPALAATYAAAAHLLRQRACAYVAVALLPVAYALALAAAGLDNAWRAAAWAALSCLLLGAAEWVARRGGEGQRPLLQTALGLGSWRSRFASPLFVAGYGVSLVTLGLCATTYRSAAFVFGIPARPCRLSLPCSPSSRCTSRRPSRGAAPCSCGRRRPCSCCPAPRSAHSWSGASICCCSPRYGPTSRPWRPWASAT